MENINQQNKILLSIYRLTIIFLGLVSVSYAIFELPEDLLGFSFFALLAAIAELISLELFVTSRQSRVIVSVIITIASIMLFGPLAGALTHMASGIMTAMTTKLFKRPPKEAAAPWWQRRAFYFSIMATGATIAGGIYVWAGGSPGLVYHTGNILPLLATASANTLVIILILTGMLTLQTESKPIEIWRQKFQRATPLAILGGVFGGGALALVYEMFTFVGTGVIILPILLITYSLKSM